MTTQHEAAGGAREGRSAAQVAGVVSAVLLGLGLLLAVAVSTLAVRVDGHSMQPTLHDGDRLLALPGSGGAVRRFDVVLLRTPGRDSTIVKRVIGLPGDRVAIDSNQDRPFAVLIQPGGHGPWYRADFPAWAAQAHRITGCCTPEGSRSGAAAAQTVPAGKVFFLGDNPDGSDDSRTYGWGDLGTLGGRVGLRVWPPAAAGSLDAGPVLTEVPEPLR